MLRYLRPKPAIKGFRLMGWLLLMAILVSQPLFSAGSPPAGPQTVIAEISDRLLHVLASERERIRSDPDYVYLLADQILVPHIDFERVSSLVLGKHWRQATAEQREQFIQQFQRLLVRTYSTAFNEIGAWEIRFIPTRVGQNDRTASVRAQLIRAQQEPIDVLYSMHLTGGSWKAYDVKISGISLVTNYRASFSQEVRRIGIDGLIGKITSLNDRRSGEAEAGNS